MTESDIMSVNKAKRNSEYPNKFILQQQIRFVNIQKGREAYQMLNQDFRAYAKEHKVRLWQIAKKMNVSEAYITRLLRNDLSEEKKESLMKIVDEIANEQQ